MKEKLSCVCMYVIFYTLADNNNGSRQEAGKDDAGMRERERERERERRKS